MLEVTAAMDLAKKKINDSLENKPSLLRKVIAIIDRRWEDQMEQKLYGAVLFLNPNRFFEIRKTDNGYASRLHTMFNDVLEKMIIEDDKQAKISNQADDYENMQRGFSSQLAIRQQKNKTPILWWGAFGGVAQELQAFARRIIGLCCSASGCERNWNTFEFIHTKKKNRLERKRLNDMVYI